MKVLSCLGLGLEHGSDDILARAVENAGKAGEGIEGVEETDSCDEGRWACRFGEEFWVGYDRRTVALGG